MKPVAVVTGVSTGIGAATVAHLLAQGFEVFGSVRKAADGERLRGSWGADFRPLVFDVTDEAAVRAAAAEVASHLKGRRLAGLVNNAGIAVAGPLSDVPLAQMRHQLEVNLIGVLAVTQAFLPLLGTAPERQGPPGRIVMLSSVGGQIGAPFLGPYVASKFGLEGLSHSLRRELRIYGIDVVMVAPGHVATPIWDKAEEAEIAPYAHLPIAPALRRFRELFIAQGRRGFPPARIAEVIGTALTTPRPRSRYAVVPGRLMNWTIPKLLPDRWVDAALGAQLGLRPPPRVD